MPELLTRNDILHSANLARFYLRHYAKGFFPVPFSARKNWRMPVNRLFIPLRNPNGAANTIRDNRRTYELKENCLYFIPAFCEAEFHLDESLYFLSIQNNLEVFPGVELFSGCTWMLELPAPPELPELLRLFESPPEKLALAALKVRSLVLSMQTALIDRFPPEAFQRPLALREYRNLTDYLDARGNARSRVPELAALMNQSREGFTRIFRKRTGLTPKQLIDRFLIRKSLELMNGGLSIKEVACRLKFSNEFVFSRFFRRQVGEAPGAWRRRNAPVCREEER